MKRFLSHRIRVGHVALLAAFALTILVTGCSDDPAQSTPAFQASGAALLRGGTDLVLDSNGVHGTIDVTVNDITAEIGISFIAKSDSKRTVPTGTDFKLGWAVADSSVATVEAAGAWSFKVRGVKEGTTTVTFKVMHGTNADYTSSPITITVHPAVRGLAKGDTATFVYYDRDTLNQRVQDSKRRKVWVVAQTNLTVAGKSNVSLILQSTFDMAGTEQPGVDSIYLVSDVDGSIYQYDLLHSFLSHVTAGEAFGSSLQPLWVKLTNTQRTTVDSWHAMGVDSQTVKNVQPPGIPLALDVTFRLEAAHKGTQAATVLAGSYPYAVHTDQTLKLLVKPSSIPTVTALDDSLGVHCDASNNEGILRMVLESKILVAKIFTQSATLYVYGYDMELESLKRK